MRLSLRRDKAKSVSTQLSSNGYYLAQASVTGTLVSSSWSLSKVSDQWSWLLIHPGHWVWSQEPHKDVAFISSHQQECCPTALEPDTTGPSFWVSNFLYSVDKSQGRPHCLTNHNGPAIDESCLAHCSTATHSSGIFHLLVRLNRRIWKGVRNRYISFQGEYQYHGLNKAWLYYNPEAMCKAVLHVWKPSRNRENKHTSNPGDLESLEIS